jgi:hypothetical protein
MGENASPQPIHGASWKERSVPSELRRGDDDPVHGSEPRHHEIAARGAYDADRQIRLPARQVDEGLPRIESDSQGRIASEELTEERHDDRLCEVRRRGDAHEPRDLAFQLVRRAGEPGHRVLDLLGERQQLLGGLGRRDAVAPAVEQGRRQYFLQGDQSARHRRSVHAERPGGTPDGPRAGKGEKQTHVVPVQIE